MFLSFCLSVCFLFVLFLAFCVSFLHSLLLFNFDEIVIFCRFLFFFTLLFCLALSYFFLFFVSLLADFQYSVFLYIHVIIFLCFFSISSSLFCITALSDVVFSRCFLHKLLSPSCYIYVLFVAMFSFAFLLSLVQFASFILDIFYICMWLQNYLLSY